MNANSATLTRAIGKNLQEARLQAGLSQAQLARAARIARLRLVRLEIGKRQPTLDESLGLARALKVPLQRLISGRWQPATNLRGIAFELYHLGVRDLEVVEPSIPGAFRPLEQVLVLAVQGDRPDPRIIEAIPFVLARRRFNVPLIHAFAAIHDPRASHRLAWLSDITLAISRLATFPIELRTERQLEALIRSATPPNESDSLGHPQTARLPAVSKRWNVTYACDVQGFLQRTIDLNVIGGPARQPEFDE
jgi:transcriptional regulator with XRE-family HTH domain